MNCDTCRTALSARLDGEDPGVDREAVDAHLDGCAACRAFLAHATELHRRVRVRLTYPVPDLTPQILTAIGQTTARQRGTLLRDVRWVLAAVAVLRLLAVLTDTVAGPWSGAPVHVVRELGSFDLALTVGFLTVAWQPTRAFGLLPLVGALAVCLGVTSVVDVATGRVPAAAEVFHLLDVLGFALVWWLARSARPPRLRARP
jgi:predicted anti-sigma-YlaC factor YlaD